MNKLVSLIITALLLAPLAALLAADSDAVDRAKCACQGLPEIERTVKGCVFVSCLTGGPKEPPQPPEEPAVMKKGVKLFTDREYAIDEMPEPVRGLPFLRTSIEKLNVRVTKPGTLYALTPTMRPGASSQEAALQKAGFVKVDVPEVQLFPREINRVSLYRKEVKKGERLLFKKMVLLIMDKGVEVIEENDEVDARTEPPVIITEPGAEF